MSQQPLTIRNLTSVPVEITRWELIHYEPSRDGTRSWWTSQGLSPIDTWNISSLAQDGTSKDLQTTIEVLGMSRIDVMPTASSEEALRIFVKIQDEIYRTHIPHAHSHSQHLTRSKANPDQSSKHYSVYHVTGRHLVLASQKSYNSWMYGLRNDVLLSAISIPGTHNSPAYHRALPSVRCQAVPILDQLNNGIRFLDIRVQIRYPSDASNKDLILVHGAFSVSSSSQSCYFAPLLQDVQTFLAQNPSETIVMSLKREGTGSGTDAQLCRLLRRHYANDNHHWFTAPRVPFVEEARGKIVLIRRFRLDEDSKNEWGGAGWGVDAETWDENTPHALCVSGQVCVQDFYQVLHTKTIEKKIQYAVEHLQRAAERVYDSTSPFKHTSSSGKDPPGQTPFFINFLTASNLWRKGCWPEKIAAKLNPAILEHLCSKHNEKQDGSAIGDGSTGIVVCDWVGHHGNWDIVKCIIGMNACYERSRENPPASLVQ